MSCLPTRNCLVSRSRIPAVAPPLVFMTITRIRHLTTAGYSPTGDVAPPAPPCGRGFLHRRALIQNEGPPKWLIGVLGAWACGVAESAPGGGIGGGTTAGILPPLTILDTAKTILLIAN